MNAIGKLSTKQPNPDFTGYGVIATFQKRLKIAGKRRSSLHFSVASFYDFLKESLIKCSNSSDLSKIEVTANAANAAVIGANKRSPLK